MMKRQSCERQGTENGEYGGGNDAGASAVESRSAAVPAARTEPRLKPRPLLARREGAVQGAHSPAGTAPSREPQTARLASVAALFPVAQVGEPRGDFHHHGWPAGPWGHSLTVAPLLRVAGWACSEHPNGHRKCVLRVVAAAVLMVAVAVSAGAQAAPVRQKAPQPACPAATPRPTQPALSPSAAYWWSRATGKNIRNPARALLVSRFQFEKLRPFKSWQDLAALRDYVEWSDRAEAAGFHDGEVVADVSENDLILLRVPAVNVRASVAVRRDPVGYAVLDPGRAGLVRIQVRIAACPAEVPDLPRNLPIAPVPMIHAAVPAGAGPVVAIYGEALEGKQARVFSRKGAGEILYASPQQINARMPSLDQVRVEVDGLSSEWAEVEP